MSLMDSLIQPIVLYGYEIWGPRLLESNWASVKRVQILLLQCIIKCKQIVPQHIIVAEFGTQPFRHETVINLVSYLHRIRSFLNSTKGKN